MDIKAYIKQVGGSELARQLGCSKQLVSHWRTGRCTPSIEWAIKIEEHSGGKIRRQDIAPEPFKGMVV